MTKPFKTVEEQVEILKQRGLQIKDDAVTDRYLLFNNYYNVVNHYGKLFQINTDIYTDGATFDEIRCLFLFDKELKSLLFKACPFLVTLMTTIMHKSYRLTDRFANNTQINALKRLFDLFAPKRPRSINISALDLHRSILIWFIRYVR